MVSTKNMTKYSLIQELNAIKNISKSHRDKIGRLVLKDESLFTSLIEITFDYKNDTSVKAALILEIVCEQRLDWIAYNLPYFTEHIANLENESAIRPASKICNLIAQEINSKFDSPIKIIATEGQLSQIIETCFDWLNKDETKVASKAHAMEALYFLGKQNPWIHYELKMIIEKNIPLESPAYSARGTKILELLAKNDLA
tara:strand:+ start:144767 stop:145366 length:600 start_codon:yes stop_codon:yes gene_type:complete